MTENSPSSGIPPDVEKVLREQIDSVPHLEALLLLWNTRPKEWLVDELAKALFVSTDSAAAILDDLSRRRLIVYHPRRRNCHYDSDPSRDPIVFSLDQTYRRELIQVTRFLHAKPSASVRAFARAFRIKQDRD